MNISLSVACRIGEEISIDQVRSLIAVSHYHKIEFTPAPNVDDVIVYSEYFFINELINNEKPSGMAPTVQAREGE